MCVIGLFFPILWDPFFSLSQSLQDQKGQVQFENGSAAQIVLEIYY